MDEFTRWECPGCRAPLLPGDSTWECPACGATFDALLGIPDLRTRDDAYLDNRADWDYARRLADDFHHLDFRGLLDRYFDLDPSIPPDLRTRQIAHILTAPGRARHWFDAVGGEGTQPLLDLGCGSGSFLSAVGPGLTAGGLGVDIALRWLVVARKRLDEEGMAHVPLVCACAEDLPLARGSVGRVVAGDVIEHVGDQAQTLAEAYRVLAPGGRLFMASPNRYSLAPEPHVGVWGVGFLPRRWMAGYVRATRGVDFRAIRTMGAAEWRKLLRDSPFGGGRVFVPPLPRDDLATFGPLKRLAGRAYNAAIQTALGRRLGRAIGPLFHVVCEKLEVPVRPNPSRPIRRDSRPIANPKPAAQT